LLTLKPTPDQLVWWMSHEEELDRLLKGTELAAFIYRGAGSQRGGVLGALNMVADSLKLLPKESETKQRWTTDYPNVEIWEYSDDAAPKKILGTQTSWGPLGGPLSLLPPNPMVPIPPQ
jgi:hypothetical protein